jgi:hypothetical protein
VDSESLEGDAGVLCCFCWTGEAEGVDGPRKEAKRLMEVRSRRCLALPLKTNIFGKLSESLEAGAKFQALGRLTMTRKRKNRTHLKGGVAAATTTTDGVPKSFIIKHGQVGSSLTQLVRDVRKVMEPNTASRLKVCFRSLFSWI